MNEITDRFVFDYRINSSIDSDEIADYPEEAGLLPNCEEHDIWARRALAANGFGDY
jgi:hypothetical protein